MHFPVFALGAALCFVLPQENGLSRRFAPRNDRGEVSLRTSALPPLTPGIFPRALPAASLQAQTPFCLLHVIASQCAHWCGNPFSPQGNLAGRYYFGQIRMHFPVFALGAALCFVLPQENGLPRRGAAAPLLAMTCKNLLRVRTARTHYRGKFPTVYEFALSAAFSWRFLRGRGLPHQCAHWFAMTCRRRAGVSGCKDVARKVRGNMPGVSGGKALVRNDTSPPVIARSEATWQSVSPAVGRRGEQYFGRIRESAYGFARSSARLLGFSAGRTDCRTSVRTGSQ